MIAEWTHPQSKQIIKLATIENLITTWETTPMVRARNQAWKQLHEIGVDLRVVIEDLERRLERGDEMLPAVCQTSEDVKREELWLSWLKHYEAACDAQRLIVERVTDRKAAA